MQNSSAFQFLALDTVHESATNPRRTFEESKLHELAESIRQHGLIQPITVRPNAEGFEIVAGARRFRAAQLAELFAIPARIVEIDDAQALEWALVESRCASMCILTKRPRDYASYCTSLLVRCISWFPDFPLRYLRSWLRSGESASGAS